MSDRLPLMMDESTENADEAQMHAAVHGATPSGEPIDELGTFLASMRTQLSQPPDAQTRWNHLGAMRRAVPVAQKRHRVRGLVAVAVASVGLVAVTTGLAAADRLPRSAQDQVAKLAEYVGVDLPGNDRGPAASVPKPDASSDRPTRGTESTGRDGPPGSRANDARPDDVNAPAGATSTAPAAAPGQTPAGGTSPGSSGSAPGHTGETPAPTATPPGSTGSAPGNSGNAPGQTGQAPGKSGSAPGHTGEKQGKSGSAPGQSVAPGKPASTPSATAKAKHTADLPDANPNG
jgi:hypothetical protein